MLHLRDAARRIESIEGCEPHARSMVYETEPEGGPPQGRYLNAAVCVHTGLSARSLLDELLRIEKEMGRKRTEKNGPRIIDLDIVFHGSRIISEPALKIPHPRFRERGFVLLPLNDIMPAFEDPETGRAVEDLLDEWKGAAQTDLEPLYRF